MTIISNTNKFIYLKSHKTGGTSVYASLVKYLNDCDLHKCSDINYVFEYFEKKFNKNGPRLYATLEEVRNILGENWNLYFSATNVRNPWDTYVSLYFYDRFLYEKVRNDKDLQKNFKPFYCDTNDKNILRTNFKKYIFDFHRRCNQNNIIGVNRNDDYIFGLVSSEPIVDFVIRFENLQEDYNKFCNEVGLPVKPLLKLKSF